MDICLFFFISFRHINLPPFLYDLQIMADAGFANIQPVITPAALNRIAAGPMKEMIKRYMYSDF